MLDLDTLIKQLTEIRAEHGNLTHLYVDNTDRLEEGVIGYVGYENDGERGYVGFEMEELA